MPNIFQELSKKIVATITMLTDKKLQFRDTGIYLQSSSDGVLDIVSDTTVALSGAVTADSTVVVTGATTLNGALTTDGITLNTATMAGSANVADDAGFVSLTGAGAGTELRVWLGTPVVGREITFTKTGAGSAYVVLAAGSTFDGSNGTASFDTAAETLKLVGITATRYAIIENVGSVELND